VLDGDALLMMSHEKNVRLALLQMFRMDTVEFERPVRMFGQSESGGELDLVSKGALVLVIS